MTKEKKAERRKPGSYPPKLDLQEAVKIVTDLYEKAGGEASLDDLSAITGNSRKSSNFTNKLNLLKNYYLVWADDERVGLTETAELIVNPRDRSEKNGGLKDAFLQWDVFSSIYEKFVGKILPQDEFLRNSFAELVPRDLADEWMSKFKSSAQFAGLLMDRGDGKFQVREFASEQAENQSKEDREREEREADERAAKLIREELGAPYIVERAASSRQTQYQFLIDILDAEMEPEEQQAVWTLIQYLKRKEAGLSLKDNPGQL